MQRVQTDYQPISKLILAYPQRFYNGYDELLPFYDELISLIPEELTIWAITNSDQTSDKLQDKFSHRQLNTFGIRNWDEIWLRDCIGINKGNSVIKPEYYPSYCDGDLTKYYKQINNKSRTIISGCLEKEIIDLPLKLDCGNFVCNDEYVYLTDKVLKENNDLGEIHIKQILNDVAGLIPIFIEENKSDPIGHMDGYMNFIDDNTALLATYPSFPFLKDDIDFITRLEQDLKSKGIEIIKLYDRPVGEGANNCGCNNKSHSSCFFSARGVYINFLQLNRTIILPEFTLPTKRESDYYNKINQEILEGLGFEVKRINCDLLSMYGGVLHCMSFTA
jgi:agmatine/peptidylarginine deiminase